MDFFNGNSDGEMVSIQDMIEHDMRSPVGESLMHNSSQMFDSSSQPPLSIHSIVSLATGQNQALSSTANSSFGNNSVTTIHNLSNVSMESSGELHSLSWLQNMNVGNGCLQQQAMVENTDPNLMVDPQTGLPINRQRHPSQSGQQIHGHQIQGQIVGYELAQSAVPVTFTSSAGTPTVQYVTIQDSTNRQPVYISQAPVSLQQALRTLPQSVAQYSYSTPTTTHVQQGFAPTPATVKIINDEKQFPKPVYSYSCLIAMSLKNSKTGSLPVSEIYNFMTSNFPYFKTAPDGWKNSVRHNLSLNKCFEKIENPKSNGNTRKGCLWAMNPAKIKKMDDEISKWNKKDPIAIRKSMANPDVLEILERGQGQLLIQGNQLPQTTAVPTSNAQEVNMALSSIKTEPFTSLKEADMFMNSDILDHSLNLDPALSELALQNGIWDDEELFDVFPITTSPISLSRLSSPPGYNSTSPIRLTPTGGDVGYYGSYVCTPRSKLNGDADPRLTPSKMVYATS